MKLYTKKDRVVRIIRAIGILCFIAGMAVIFRSTPSLKETTTVYAESQKQTQLNVRDICLDGYKWKVFIAWDGRIINVEQVLTTNFNDGDLKLVTCTSNSDDVKVIK